MCAVADESAKSSGVLDRELEEEEIMLCRFMSDATGLRRFGSHQNPHEPVSMAIDTVLDREQDYRLSHRFVICTYRSHPMKTVKHIALVFVAISLLVVPLAWSQGGNPPASTKESGKTSGHGQTAVEQTATSGTPGKKAPSEQVQQALIALDKQWGEAGSKGDTGTLNKILSDSYLGIGAKGEGFGKQEQVAATTATSSTVQNASYTADEYKFETLTPDVIVMTHRATTKGMQDGKETTESHRSLHVFQKRGGQWQVVANAQLPIKD